MAQRPYPTLFVWKKPLVPQSKIRSHFRVEKKAIYWWVKMQSFALYWTKRCFQSRIRKLIWRCEEELSEFKIRQCPYMQRHCRPLFGQRRKIWTEFLNLKASQHLLALKRQKSTHWLEQDCNFYSAPQFLSIKMYDIASSTSNLCQFGQKETQLLTL